MESKLSVHSLHLNVFTSQLQLNVVKLWLCIMDPTLYEKEKMDFYLNKFSAFFRKTTEDLLDKLNLGWFFSLYRGGDNYLHKSFSDHANQTILFFGMLFQRFKV